MRCELRKSALRALLATALMTLTLQSASGTGEARGTPRSLVGRWVGTWTNVDNIETGTESFVVQTQVGTTITGFFCWNVRLDPATCSANIGNYEPWTGTIGPNGGIKIKGQIGDYSAKQSPDGNGISGNYQNRTLVSHTGRWSVRRASVK
jgi:hypothetical protein